MEGLKLMSFEVGNDMGIRCRFISEWFKVDSYVPNKEKLLSEIKRIKPDVVVIDIDLYADIDGIETTRTIRTQYNIHVMYQLNINKKSKAYSTLPFLRADNVLLIY